MLAKAWRVPRMAMPLPMAMAMKNDAEDALDGKAATLPDEGGACGRSTAAMSA